MNKVEAITELISILNYILENEDVSIYPSAIEGSHNTNFNEWESMARKVIKNVNGMKLELNKDKIIMEKIE